MNVLLLKERGFTQNALLPRKREGGTRGRQEVENYSVGPNREGPTLPLSGTDPLHHVTCPCITPELPCDPSRVTGRLCPSPPSSLKKEPPALGLGTQNSGVLRATSLFSTIRRPSWMDSKSLYHCPTPRKGCCPHT